MRTLFAFLILSASLWSADPPITLVAVPPAKPAEWNDIQGIPDVGRVVTLDSKAPENAKVNWVLVDDAEASLTANGNIGKLSVPKDGIYRVMLVSNNEPYRYRIVVGKVDPFPQPPGPGPAPIPPTPPVPTGTVKRIVVVEDSRKAGAWRGDLFGSPLLLAHYKANGLKHSVIDINDPAEIDPKLIPFVEKTQGKELPWLFTLDATGQQIAALKCPLKPDEFLVAIGGQLPNQRKMGNRAPPQNKLRLAWKNFGDAPVVPIIPRAEWKSVNLEAFLPPVYDQDGIGQCNASATCTALEACRAQAGLTPIHLSAGDLYSQINGGRDDGSLLEDGLEAAMKNGVARTSTVKYLWDGRNHGNEPKVQAERKDFLVLEAYVCPNFDAMASALQQGFFIIEGLMWADGDEPDRDGWIPDRPRGGQGGHALCGYGLIQSPTGTWGIRTRNSWSTGWGAGGNCVIPERRFNSAIGGFWAVRAVKQTYLPDFPVPRGLTLAPKFDKLDARPIVSLKP